MEKRDGDDGPLWRFVDDVGVGKPVIFEKQNKKQAKSVPQYDTLQGQKPTFRLVVGITLKDK